MNGLFEGSIEVESASGVREIRLTTRHLMQRRVFLTGEINNETALELVSKLMYLEGEDETKPVRLYINSPGGSVNDGLLIYDVLESMKAPVERYCIGMAASMAAIILAGGKKGNRFILPHSGVMIHEPLAGGMGGSATSIKRKADSILETRDILNGLLAKHTGRDVDEIGEATAFDNYMDAEEAVAFGLCDKIVTCVF